MRKTEALRYFGSAQQLYRAAAVSRQAYAKWGAVIPYRTALYLEEWSEGGVKLDPALYDGRKVAKYRRKP